MTAPAASFMIHPFDTNDRNNVNQRWLQYAAFLNVYFSNANITDDNVKKQQLQLYGGPTLANLIERKTTKTTYKEIVEEVATLLKPSSNSTNATTEFRRLTQFEGEQFSSFVDRVTDAAEPCEFADAAAEISFQLYTGARSLQFKRRYIEAQHTNKKRPTKNEAIAFGLIEEATARDLLGQMQPDAAVLIANINTTNTQPSQQQQQQPNDYSQRQRPPRDELFRQHQRSDRCFSCGQDDVWPHKPRESCPAYDKRCSLCGLLGHYTRCCRKQTNRQHDNDWRRHRQPPTQLDYHRQPAPQYNHQHAQPHEAPRYQQPFQQQQYPTHHTSYQQPHQQQFQQFSPPRQRHPSPPPANMHNFQPRRHNSAHTNTIIEYANDDHDAEQGWTEPTYTANVNMVRSSLANSFMPLITLLICGSQVDMNIDTGSQVNIIDEDTFRRLANKPELQHATTTLYGYNSTTPISTLGQFTSSVRASQTNNEANLRFIVTQGSAGNLLTYRSATQLNAIGRIGNITEERASTNDTSSTPADNSTRHDNKAFEIVKNKFPDLFTGQVGCFNQYSVQLHIDTSIAPVREPMRTVAIPLRKAVTKELQSMLDQDIIEPAHGPTPWVSAICPVPKANGEVRITIDGRAANRAIQRARYIMPTLDDLIVALNGATHFSRLDMKAGYHQIVIDKHSRYITTFATHMGLFQYKRLNMGISSSSELFQRIIANTINGIPGSLNFSDDIIVFGSNKEDHDNNLHQVLNTLSRVGLTLNPNKCLFAVTELDFYGMHFSEKGMSIQQQKIKALQDATPPKTQSEVRSLLGLAKYCTRQIPNLATICDPLAELTRAKTPFEWSEVHDKAFNTLKAALTNDAVAYFRDDWNTVLTVDASPVGLGAILSQEDPLDGSNTRVVQYASRSLSDTERRYHQIEKEALAVIWAMEHFHNYIYGRPLEVVSDNTTVVSVFSNPRSKPKARLENWSLRLQRYNYTIRHTPGSNNMADFMSRSPVSAPPTEPDEVEAFVNAIVDYALPTPINRHALRTATLADPILTQVKRLIKQLDNTAPTEYKRHINELTITEDGLVVKGNTVVPPVALRPKLVELAHHGHQGTTKTFSLLQRHVWWPHMDHMVTQHVQTCLPCSANTDTTHITPLKMSEMPEHPWSEVAVDFYGPLRSGHHLLVVVDECSRYPVVRKVTSTAANNVLPVLDEIFAMLGVPTKIKSDNGPPFNGHLFKDFVDSLGITHVRVTPYWPRANGLCERFMRNLGAIMRKANVSNTAWEQELQEFLRAYRATPHSSTHKTPCELMFRTPVDTSRISNMRTTAPANREHIPQPSSPQRKAQPQQPTHDNRPPQPNSTTKPQQPEPKQHQQHQQTEHTQTTTQQPTLDQARENDATAKEKMKSYTDAALHVKPTTLQVGDLVLCKNMIRPHKAVPLFSPTAHMITKLTGNQATTQSTTDGHTRRHNVSQLKSAPPAIQRRRAASSDCLSTKVSATSHDMTTAVTIMLKAPAPRHIHEPPPDPHQTTRPIRPDPIVSTTTDNNEDEDENTQTQSETPAEAATIPNNDEQQEVEQNKNANNDDTTHQQQEQANHDTTPQHQEQANNSPPEAEGTMITTHQQHEQSEAPTQAPTNDDNVQSNTRRSTRAKQRPERYEDQRKTRRHRSSSATEGAAGEFPGARKM